MTDYASKGFTPLSQADWEKVRALNWTPTYKSSNILRLLKMFETSDVVPNNHGNWDNGRITEGMINGNFRRAGLPYRVFKTRFGSDAHRIGIVTPFKRDGKSRKIKLTSNGREIVVYVLATAHAVVKNPSRKNLAALERALRHPRLPTSYIFNR